VDAIRDDEVSRLRKLKHHEEKPLAVMCRSLAEAKQLAHIDEQARSLLLSVYRPIVIVPKRHPSPLASCIAPVNHNVGFMLPYTPLHVLLLASAPPALVMTSGNLAEEPIAIDNEEALSRLSGIADVFLLHDRDILVPNDDSVLRIISRRPSFIRRSRGYVPLPVVLGHETPPILAVGGELKNTICITRGRMAFLSQHIGDMESPSTIEYFTKTVKRLSRILDVKPRLIAADLHPDYAATRWAEQQELQVLKVQHHHAHIAGCMAEHRIEGPVIGVALDGTGFGTDGRIWGGEILVCDMANFERAGHLDYVQLPGGDRAVAEPWRMALSYLLHTFGNAWEEHLPENMHRIPAKKRQAVIQMMMSGVNSPWTSSCGRLFDGVAALLGLHHKVAFEGQAAMRLEMVAGEHDGNAADGGYEIQPRAGNDGFLIDPADFVRGVVGDIERGLSARAISRRFHAALAHTFSLACVLLRRQTGLNQVALSGGVFQNRLLTESFVDELEAAGFDVLLHKQVPANDGGLSLGQAVVAAHRSLTASGKSAAQGL
jgi:hydrogenase maturation protein HypF